MINDIKPEVSVKTQVDNKDSFDEAMTKFINRIDEKIGEYYEEILTNLTCQPIETKPGRRFIKLTRDGQVYCFVEKSTGNVYKPATWRAPYLKGKSPIRGNIYDSSTYYDKQLYAGSWLYA